MSNDDRQIRSIYQLCIRGLTNGRYKLSFIYEMTDGGYTSQEYELNTEQVQAYYSRKDWDAVLPEEGKTIEVVHAGRLRKGGPQ